MNTEYFDVVIVGAGLSGIGIAYHLQKRNPGLRYCLLERRAVSGGTWDLFRYPGIRSDSDMRTYGYSFKPWNASRIIAEGNEILRYIRETAAEHGIERHIRYQRQLQRAAWSSTQAAWSLEVAHSDSGDSEQIRCNFLIMAAGYYDYEAGYTPEFPGHEQFRGPIIHPQDWPEKLDYRDKRIVVIGSGATAVSLIPPLAAQAAHVTMLQRSPSYVMALPAVDPFAETLGRFLPEEPTYRLTRWKNIAVQQGIYWLTRIQPQRMRTFFIRQMQAELGPDFDVATHFSPRYNPWDQRLCITPDGDFFAAIRSGKVSVVTDHIAHFGEYGICLQSGRELPADIIVTATGLRLKLLGGVEFAVDGKPVDFGRHYSYKGLMFSDIPNLISIFGYTNASWTLRVDLAGDYICRLIKHMRRQGWRRCSPRLRPSEQGMATRPAVADFTPGYIQRDIGQFPRQGDQPPWLNQQNYWRDRHLMRGLLADGVLQFEH
jgi:cation diffusion facilitator CzcD-associated flavoprotein CzcO